MGLVLKLHNTKKYSQYVDGNIDKWVPSGKVIEINDIPGIVHALTETTLEVIEARVVEGKKPILHLGDYVKPKVEKSGK